LVKVLRGCPIDGVALTIGCDKTLPACLMAAATVNIPAIALSVGPMLDGNSNGRRTGSGTIVWKVALIRAGIQSLPCVGAGGSPSILNASPKACHGIATSV